MESQQGYAASASERPMSEGVGSVGEPPQHAHVHEPPTSAAYGSEKMNGGSAYGGPATGVSEGFWKTGGETFLLASFVLGLIAWITALVATAVVAATISGPAVRILWFAIIIQAYTTFLVFQVIAGSRMYQYNAGEAFAEQIAILSALACVFAVIGVDRTIYSPISSEQATGAGWLLVAITDLLWILYFTSPQGSHFERFAVGTGAVFGGRRGRKAEAEQPNKVQKISRSTDAFNTGPAVANPNTNSGRYDDQSVEMSKVGHGQEPSAHSAQNRTASGRWSTHTPASGNNTNARGTVVSAGEGGRDSAATGSIPLGGTAAAQAAGVQPPMSPGPIPEASKEAMAAADAKWRAQAMFEYKGSLDDPSELAFKKGEILLIFDKSGKWWEAQNAEGKKGIAPSNYLRLL